MCHNKLSLLDYNRALERSKSLARLESWKPLKPISQKKNWKNYENPSAKLTQLEVRMPSERSDDDPMVIPVVIPYSPSYPLVHVYMTMENHHFQWEINTKINYKWAIFNSYISLPEGNSDLIENHTKPNIATESGPFIVALPMNFVIFHSLPEGNSHQHPPYFVENRSLFFTIKSYKIP